MRWDYYFITDSSLTKEGIVDDVTNALKAGCQVIQYREKVMSTRSMCEQGSKIRELCNSYDAIYIVNDRVDVALATGADGVHLGQSDMVLETGRRLMPRGMIGISITSVEEGIEAKRNGADYLGIGPIYPTDTKIDADPPIGLGPLRELKQKVDIPLVAIGGIEHKNISEIVSAGADGIAAISATAGVNVYEKVKGFLIDVEEAKHGRGN